MSEDNIIILIEDDENIRELSASILERSGFIVKPFDAPQDALQYQLDDKPRLKALITDYYFEDGTALEFIDKFRELQSGLPILIATGDREVNSRNLKLNHASIIYKPFRKKELLEAINAL